MNEFSSSTLLGKSVHRMGLSSGYGLDEAGVRVALDLGVNYFWYTRSTMPAMTGPLKERVKADRDSLFIASGPTTWTCSRSSGWARPLASATACSGS